jgi:acetolactate synthase-like protein
MRADEERVESENAAKSQMPCQPGKTGSNTHLNPMAVAYAIDRLLTPQSILIGDGGDFVGTCSYILRPRGPLQWLDPGPFGTLGVGAAFAIAAKLARPAADVWLLWGDGSAGYSIMEYDTCLRFGIPFVSVIGNDACWTQIARDQIKTFGDDVACPLLYTDYDRVAVAIGCKGYKADTPAALAQHLAAASQ